MKKIKKIIKVEKMEDDVKGRTKEIQMEEYGENIKKKNIQ